MTPRKASKRRRRSGLRIRGARGHPKVRRALIRYAKWLRANHEFPIRVTVYLSPRDEIITMHGPASASCFIPWDRAAEPYIRIATGDYNFVRKQWDGDDCILAYLASLSHEVIHYQQWIEHDDMWERGVAVRARAMVERYAETVDHP